MHRRNHSQFCSKDPLSAEKVFEMKRKTEEASHRGQRRIRKLLQKLRVTQEGSETSSVGILAAATRLPNAKDDRNGGDFLFRSGSAGGTRRPQRMPGTWTDGGHRMSHEMGT
jgi:hypothetical protein